MREPTSRHTAEAWGEEGTGTGLHHNTGPVGLWFDATFASVVRLPTEVALLHAD